MDENGEWIIIVFDRVAVSDPHYDACRISKPDASQLQKNEGGAYRPMILS